MKYRTFIDTNVFIYSFEFPDSNSAKIIKLLSEGKVEAIISERVLKEVTHYFKKYYPLVVARKFRRFLLDSCILIMREEVLQEIGALKNKIKEKDVEQLAVTKKYGLKFLLSFDRDFEGFEEYINPKRFIESLDLEANESDF